MVRVGAVAVGMVRVAAVAVGMVSVAAGSAGGAAVGITLVVAGGVIEAVGAVGVDDVAMDTGEVALPFAGGTDGVEPAGFGAGGVETEDDVAAVGALGAVGEGRGVADGFGDSLFARYSCAARVATRRKRTRRKMRPMTTAKASSEKKPHTTSPASPRKPAPMSYIPGKIGLCMTTPPTRRRRVTAPRLSPLQ